MQGAKRKVIEDVRFIVRDSESSESFGDDLDPGEQLLETLSGGESVWIKAALSEAIGRVRQERMNVSWRTALRDEADAGLDEGAAASYWRLVEAAHAMSGRHHTVAITHSGAQHGLSAAHRDGRRIVKWKRGKWDGWERGPWHIYKSVGVMGMVSWTLRRGGSRVGIFRRLKDAKEHAQRIEMGGEA